MKYITKTTFWQKMFDHHCLTLYVSNIIIYSKWFRELQVESVGDVNQFFTPLQRTEDKAEAAASFNKLVTAAHNLG